MSFNSNLRNLVATAALGASCLTALSACGPTQSARDQQQAQIRADNRKTSDEYSAVVGLYKGTVTSEDGDVFKVELRIWLTTETLVNAGTATPTEIPTLAGSLTIKTPPLEDIESFSSGTYDQQTGQTTLYSAVTASNPTGSVPNASLAVHLHYTSNGKMTGSICSVKCNTLDVTRVNPAAPKNVAKNSSDSNLNTKALN